VLWDDYTKYKEAMLSRTHTSYSPWVIVNISVTALGYVAPGTSVGNEVGLYNMSGGLITSASVNNLSTPINGFYYQSITPVTLTAGTEYVVDGFFNGGTAVGFTADSGVGAAAYLTFNGYQYNENTFFSFPNSGPYSPPIFGPNFQYNVVPEPTTMVAGALLLLPFGASTLRMLRRRTA